MDHEWHPRLRLPLYKAITLLRSRLSLDQRQVGGRKKIGDQGLSISLPALGHRNSDSPSTLNNSRSWWTRATMTDHNENLRNVRKLRAIPGCS